MPNPKRLQPPWRGVTDTQPFVEQPGDACPPGAMLNMRPRDVGSGRRRFSKRPAADKVFDTQIGNGNGVQALISVPKSVSQSVGPARLVESGSSVAAGLFRGQALILDPDWSVRAAFNDTRRDPAIADPPTGYGGPGGFFACWDPDNVNVGFFGTVTKNVTLTTQDVYVVGINRVDADTNTVTHQGYAVDADPGYSTPLPASGQINLYANQFKCAFGALFVAVGTYIYVFDADDLTYRQRIKLTWADEIQGLDTVTIGGFKYLAVLFTGSSVVTGPVVADSSTPAEAFGQFVRSGVVFYSVASDTFTSGPMSMPQGTQSGDGAYELHQTFRFSEYSKTRPRGCISYSFAVDSLGNFYAGRTNQGFGYSPLINASHRPDGALGPYITVCKADLSTLWTNVVAGTWAGAYIAPGTAGYGIDGSGWEVDTQSYRRAYTWNGTTYRNDIPQIVGGSREPSDDSDAPSVYALALDERSGQVYVGGRRPSPTNAVSNVYALRADDGTLLWDHDLKGLVQQHAIAVDPTSGNPVFGFNRCNGWDNNGTPSATKAEMIELDMNTGLVVRSFDLTDDVNLNTYATTDSGFGCYAVAINARGQVLMALAPYRCDT